MKKVFLIVSSFIICVLVSSFIPKFTPTFALKTVVIDAGHGGKDPGCHGSKYKEKDVALAVALKLGEFIEKNLKDVKVIYTRKTDVFIELQERANIANKAKADLFICIHCNSACYRDKKLKKDICKDFVHGAETYVMGLKNEQGKLDVAKRENSAILLEDNYVQKYDGFDPNSDESYIIMSMFTDTYLNNSLKFAAKLQEQYKGKGGRKDKGVKRASLWVLWRTYMPSVLTEIGYLTNPEEEKFLGSVKGQEYVAACIFRAFRNYKDELEGVTKKYDDEFENMPVVSPIADTVQVDDEVEIVDSVNTNGEEKVKNGKEGTEKPKETIIEKPKEEVVVKPKEEVIKKDTLEVKPKEEIKKEIIVEKPKEEVIVKQKDTVTEKPKEEEVVKPKEEVVVKPKETIVEKPKEETVVEKPKEKSVTENPIVFKVQFMMSEKKLELTSDKFKGVEKVGYYEDKGAFKYTSGEFDNIKDAVTLQNELRSKGFKDAFVIKMQGGKRIISK